LSGSFFLKELVHHRAHRLARPVELAVGDVADAAIATDEEARRQEARAPSLGHRAVAIAQQREVERHGAGKLLDARQRLGEVHGEHLERLTVERAAQAVDRRHFRAARLAPRRPEIHQHHLAAVIGEAVHLPAEVLEFERRGRATAPRLQLGRARHHGYGDEQRPEEPQH